MVPVSLDVVPAGNENVGARSGSMSLTMLIDFIVQRTYHELAILAELLPRKTDMERKIEIYKFSARTRQLFVRLLALVKWASSATKVDRSAHIMNFLDKQALLFVDTADVLARIARETLVHARLPAFHMAAAVEVLTLGTYGRLPAVIKERLVPPNALTPTERQSTLRALAHIVRQRLTTTALPHDIRNLKVENGRATFTVGHEFSVSITVMGDSPNLPWRLLDVAILVQDNETGEGKPLVHPSQLAWLKGVAQARLAVGGLSAALAALRYFCRSLSLELLYTQTLRLCRDRLAKHLQVDAYTPGCRLQLSYWKELGCELGYRLIIEAEGEGLAVSHVPALVAGAEKVSSSLALHAPSMERLLAHTVHARCRQRLHDVELLLNELGVECVLSGWPCVLACSVLAPCQRAEQLLVSVGAHGGRLRCRVPAYPELPRTQQLAAALAVRDVTQLKTILALTRYWLVSRRCEKTLQHLPAAAAERLPLVHPNDHPITQLSPHRLYVTLHRHADHVLIVEMQESGCKVNLKFHLAGVRKCAADEGEGEEQTSTPHARFLKVVSLVQLDTFALTHGPFTPLDTPGNQPGKRKLSALATNQRAVRARQPAYFLSELAHVVAAADERVPFVHLAQELASRGVCHGGVQPEWAGSVAAMRLAQLPTPNRADENAVKALQRRLLAATLRMTQRNNARVWTAELVFHSSPLRTKDAKEQGERRCVYLQYELGSDSSSTAEAFLNDWSAIVHLYCLVHDFVQIPQAERDAMWEGITIRSYNYRSLTLGIGAAGRATLVIRWRAGKFEISAPAHHPAPAAHRALLPAAHHMLQAHRDLLALGIAARDAYPTLVALGRLACTPQLGLQHARPQVPTPTFTILMHTMKKIRVIYAGVYCIEVTIRDADTVTVRDAAYSKLDRAPADDAVPIQGLKAFLSRYVDEGARPLAEDDCPPSPASPHPHHSLPTGPPSVGGGLRFPAPLTPPGPHTPLTPHPASPAHQMGGSFGLTSPPGVTASPASPLAPSPLPAPSPHSPFGAAAWPASPVPRPSPRTPRGVTQTHQAKPTQPASSSMGHSSWEARLTISALEALCTPCDPPAGAPQGPPLAPIHRFLACVYLRRHLHRFIQTEDPLSGGGWEGGALVFRADNAGLSGRVWLHPHHMQSLHLTLTPLPDRKDTNSAFSPEDIQVMEKYFESRVVSSPARPTALWAWCRAWGAAGAALVGLVALQRAELAGPAGAAWAPAWALRIPPHAPPIVPAGQPAVLLAKNKILFFVTLSRGEQQLVLPLVYDVQTNLTQLADKRDHPQPPHLMALNLHLKRWCEFNANSGGCSLWPALRDLIMNFQLPPDAAPMHPMT